MLTAAGGGPVSGREAAGVWANFATPLELVPGDGLVLTVTWRTP